MTKVCMAKCPRLVTRYDINFERAEYMRTTCEEKCKGQHLLNSDYSTIDSVACARSRGLVRTFS